MGFPLKKPTVNKNLTVLKKKNHELQDSSPHVQNLVKSLRNPKINNNEIIDMMLDNNHVTDQKIAEIFSQEYGFELIQNLEDYEVSEEVLNIIPKKICEKNLLLPIRKMDKMLIVVFANPSDTTLRDNLFLTTNFEIQPVIATRTNIKKAHKKYFNDKKAISNLVYNMSVDAGNDEEVHAVNLDQNKESEDPVISFVNLIFREAIQLQCSDIHIESYEQDFRIRYRIDGVLHKRHTLEKKMSSMIVSRIKLMSQMDISEKRKPQDSRLTIHLQNQKLSMRVSTVPTINGEKIVLRILDDSALQTDMSKLGMNTNQLELFKSVLFQPQGLILMTGPTGSGKTTTIYSGLKQLNTPEKNISTVEDPVEFRMHGINQVQINKKAGLTFSSALRAFLRQDPDIIFVGEIRDLETAEIAYKASSTGHLVLSTLHTNDTASTVTRLLSMGVPSYSISDNTSLIVSQRLLRRLCHKCRILDSSFDIRLLNKFGVNQKDIPAFENKIYKKNTKNCSECNGLGYKGRVAIYEMMKITRTIKQGIFDKASPSELKNMAIEKDNLESLKQSALLKLQEGIISKDEFINSIISE